MLAPKKNTYVDGEISRVVIKLQEEDVDSDEYRALLETLNKLHAMRQDETPDTVSSDALFQGAVTLVGIALILKYEELNVITSKSMSFIRMR